VIGGFVLDPDAIESVGRLDLNTLWLIERVDMQAQAIILPAAAVTEALTRLATPEEAARVQDLLEFGVAVTEDLTCDGAESVAVAYRAAEDETSVGMAHAEVVAAERSWPILTSAPLRWQKAYPATEITDESP
jgi:hypothetical protein